MRKISVCTVVINLDVGGLEKVAVSLLNGLDRARFDPSLICLDAPGKLFDQVDLPPERRLVLRRRPRLNLGFARVDPELPLAIRGFLRDVRADVLHVHNFAPLIFGGVSSRLLLPRPRVVYSEHNEINSASPRSLRKFRYYVRLADAIIAVSGDPAAASASAPSCGCPRTRACSARSRCCRARRASTSCSTPRARSSAATRARTW
ncbi:hypothetical protein BE21_26295 [Sorangium cellulosum]|uniref:Glycosyltransferase subfamily 4-like N-terminal domain-containing protein n=1 Tax=Sorangium cellulosum TaxID=56 RepID=A0A150TTI1_SORCE|nr:hypothetical protein BE21_26295 [Sorangium cellulosum]